MIGLRALVASAVIAGAATFAPTAPAHAFAWCGPIPAYARKPQIIDKYWVASIVCAPSPRSFGARQDVAHTSLVTRLGDHDKVWCSSAYNYEQIVSWCTADVKAIPLGTNLRTRVVLRSGQVVYSPSVRTFWWQYR